MTSLGPVVYAFFERHLKAEKGLSPASVRSYSDTLRLFLAFIAGQRHRPITRLAIQDLTAERVRQFLGHLEAERGNHIRTRNQRLAGLHTFFAYLAGQAPETLAEAERVTADPEQTGIPAGHAVPPTRRDRSPLRGRLTSDGGVLVLAEIERRLGIAERLARCIEDPRAPERVEHGLAEMIRFRALLIAAGYEDGNDCDALRADPAFKMAVGRLPESGADLCSQPTISRLENLPGPIALKRMMAAMVELFCDSFAEVPRRIVLDIDDTEDRVHGRQQLSLGPDHCI